MEIFIEILKSVLFGIVQGITEWLPISSTGHMILLEEFVSFENVSENFWQMFEVVIQFGSIIAVIVIFWDKIFPFSKKGEILGIMKRDKFFLWLKIALACVPTAIVGVFFDDQINDLFYNPITVAIMLIVVGAAFLLVESLNSGRKPKINDLASISFRTAFFIGLFQTIAAILPGTSRSGITILGGLILGVSRTVSAEFTFFLAIPVMFGASLLKLVKFGLAFTGTELAVLLTGCVTAFVVSLICIRFLMDFIKKHNFKVFGWYRIALGALVLIYGCSTANVVIVDGLALGALVGFST